jgi:glycosyltransferase involved in cell wall biosynthesis
MKILIATDNYLPNINGAAVFAHRLALNLQKHGHEVLMIAPPEAYHSRYETKQGVPMFGPRSYPLPVKPPFWHAQPFIRTVVEHAVKKFNPDVMHLQSHFAICRASMRAAKKFNIPVLGTNHFMPENLTPHLHLPKPLELKLNRWAWDYLLTTFRQLDLATAPSKAAVGLLRSIGYTGPAEVASNGIDLGIFKPRSDVARIREHYGIPNKPILMFTGRLDGEKNIDVMIKALAQARKRVDVHGVIVGGGVLRPSLEQLASALGIMEHVTFTGFVPEEHLAEIFSVGDCFMMPGTAELQSIATMEAMASGQAVILADAVALPELLDGNGFMFKPGDVQEAAGYIERIFGDPALLAQLKARSLETIKRHDIGQIIQLFESLYRRIIEGHRHTS